MASSLQKITNYGDETVIQMQSVLLGFKNIKGDTFEGATKAILDMATVMKMDLSSAAQAVGKALDDPINGITSLQRQGFRFSESQKAVIQSLIDTGDTAAAQKIILDELNTTYGGAAEAAVKSSTQIKNAWGDVLESYGREFSLLFDAVTGGSNGENKPAKFLENWAKSVNKGITEWQRIFAKDYQTDFYQKLGLDEKIEEAELQLSGWIITLEKAKNAKNKLEAQTNVDWWTAEVERVKKAREEMQEYQKEQNNILDAKNKISELTHEIGLDYKKLSNDDPVIQLENYQKQLEKIAKDKETLSINITDIDTSEAMKQLDYNADAIRAKMKQIQDKMQEDGRKSWQKYFEDITGISASSFTTGQQAGELYIQGLQKAVEDSENLSELLGKKFDSKAAIENQMAELESTITKLLNIPVDKIDEAYSTADNNIKLMIEEYRRLNGEKTKFENEEALEQLNKRLISITQTERDAFIEMLTLNEATQEQIEQANTLFDAIEQAQKTVANKQKDSIDGFVSWQNSLEGVIESWISNLNLFKESVDDSNKALAGLGATMLSLAFNGVLQGLGTLGEALGKGETAGEGLKSALEDTAQTILNQLPMLFMQAGLTLIAQGQWPLGLALIGTGLGTSLLGGLNKGLQERTEANALGNVYGAEAIPFAHGGTFTNQIVSSPTLFKFARGGKMGTGLMGEAGPEAILPLRRGADGTLGVEATTGQVNFALMVEVNNYSSERVQTQETTDENGNRKLQIMIGAAINQHIANGKADRALSSRYGLKAQGV